MSQRAEWAGELILLWFWFTLLEAWCFWGLKCSCREAFSTTVQLYNEDQTGKWWKTDQYGCHWCQFAKLLWPYIWRISTVQAWDYANTLTCKVILKCFGSIIVSGDEVCICRESNTTQDNIIANIHEDLCFSYANMNLSSFITLKWL